MRTRHPPTNQTTDTEAAAFLFASDLPLLRVEADARIGAQTLFLARRQLIRGVRLARVSPTRCITGSELAQHWLAMDAATRAATRERVTG